MKEEHNEVTTSPAASPDASRYRYTAWNLAVIQAAPWDNDELSTTLDVLALRSRGLSQRQAADQLKISRAKVRWLEDRTRRLLLQPEPKPGKAVAA